MSIVPLHDAIETMPRDYGVQVIGCGVSKLHLFPEIWTGRTHDPGHIGAEFANVLGDCDDFLVNEKLTNLRVRNRNALGILGLRGR